jgi:outer membrane protein assembly factor BamB
MKTFYKFYFIISLIVFSTAITYAQTSTVVSPVGKDTKSGTAEEFPDVAPAAGWDNLQPATAGTDNWPWWRGPALDNHSPAKNPPLNWSDQMNVRWRLPLPGRGHASPCIRGDRIFLPAGDPTLEVVWMLCFDRATGRKLWQTEVYRGPFPKIHNDNSPASSTPACDGKLVYFPYQTAETISMAALDLDGKVVWNKPVAPYKSIQGYSSSPALYKSAIIIPVDGSVGNWLIALHRQTGEVVWRSTTRKVLEGYASPLVTRVAGRDQVFLIGGFKTTSYDPNNGKMLWECDGPSDYCAATVAFSKETVYATGGVPQKALLAIRADGTGNVTATHLSWKSDNKAGYVPSPLLHEGLIYAVSDNGLMRCYDAATGQVVWEQNFKAPFYSSPVLAGDRIYVFDRIGKGYVMKTGRQFELLATNELPTGAFATPVILGDRIYIRTLEDFFCLETKL